MIEAKAVDVMVAKGVAAGEDLSDEDFKEQLE
jgi:hypothetical protein